MVAPTPARSTEGDRTRVKAPAWDQATEVFAALNPLPMPWVESADVTNAVIFLVSDEGRYITGLELKIDAGFCLA